MSDLLSKVRRFKQFTNKLTKLEKYKQNFLKKPFSYARMFCIIQINMRSLVWKKVNFYEGGVMPGAKSLVIN